MQKNIVETVMGAVVLAVAGLFLVFAYKTADLQPVEGYELRARFTSIAGLDSGSDVRISGVKIGTVLGFELDSDSFLADVRFSIDPHIKLPVDSSAEIVSEGLLDGRYLSIVPGGEEDLLGEGDVIVYTQAPSNLEQLLGKFIFSMNKEEGDG